MLAIKEFRLGIQFECDGMDIFVGEDDIIHISGVIDEHDQLKLPKPFDIIGRAARHDNYSISLDISAKYHGKDLTTVRLKDIKKIETLAWGGMKSE